MPEYTDPTRYLGNMANHQKMYDFERDILRVKNPLNEDFEFIYDMVPWVVPANGTRDMERYLVRRFIDKMIGDLYNTFAEKKMAEAEEAFKRTHPDVMDDPYLINQQIYLKMKRPDDPAFQKKVIDDCIVGVVFKHGTNRGLPNAAKSGQLDPNTPLYQSLIDGFKTLIDIKPEPMDSTSMNPTQMLG